MSKELYIYKVTRAFHWKGIDYARGQELVKTVYNMLGPNQVFVKEIFAGTEKDLEALNGKQVIDDSEVVKAGEPVSVDPSFQDVDVDAAIAAIKTDGDDKPEDKSEAAPVAKTPTKSKK